MQAESLKKIEKLIPECALFQELSSYEKRIDSFLIRKSNILHDALGSVTSRPLKTIQLSVYNTFSDQGGTYHVESNSAASTPSWTLRVEGQASDPMDKKLTSFFRRVVVQLDPALYPENHTIEWDRAQDHSLEADGFEIHREGDRELKVKILLDIAYSPPRYKLDSTLAELLRIHTETRSRVILKLWQYIRTKGKQDEKDPHLFHLDEPLQKLFQRDKITFQQMPSFLQDYLAPADPIEIDYEIKVSGDPLQNIRTFEIQVSDSKPSDSVAQSAEVTALDEKISRLVDQIDQHRTMRDVMVTFQKNPIRFLSDLAATQIHHHKVLNSNTREGEAVRLGSYYRQPLIHDAVSMYLDRAGEGGASAPGK